jgi:hypothetical protein
LYCIICATIDEQGIYPTNKQAQAYLRVCQMLSNYYRDIKLFRFDQQIGDVYILAGDNIQIIVPPDGDWRFIEQ